MVTFANHKGGVGKSTMAFFSLKELTRRFPEKKFLVIDASTAGDFTKFCFGPTLDGSRQTGSLAVKAKCTLEDFISTVQEKKWGKSVRVQDHIFRLETAGAPANLYIMTNKKQFKYDLDKLLELDDALISRVCAQIRQDLSGKDEWLVLIDTDGGEMTSFTRIAICLANSLVIPLSAAMGAQNDAWRLEPLFEYANRLRNLKLSNATVSYCFFNNVKPANNSSFEFVSGHRMSLTPSTNCKKAISDIINRFDEPNGYIDRYTDLLRPLRAIGSFGVVRQGGTAFNAAMEDPWGDDGGNAQSEIELLVTKIVESAASFETRLFR